MIIFMFRDTIAITNRQLVKGDYLEQIRRVVSCHPYGLILREKDLSDLEYSSLAEEVLRICRQGQVTCFIHTRVGIARELDCPNIHLSIPALLENRGKLEGFQQISVSCHSLEDVKLAISYGASQIILGTIFETECKKGLKGRGLSFVREIGEYCKSHGDIPVFAIGGITPDNISQVKAAGARGGCMMSYIINQI